MPKQAFRATLRLRQPEPEPAPVPTGERFTYPKDWSRGQLLNVRNAGERYDVTLLGEEFDPREPTRCLHFGSAYECQDFISWWYQPSTQGGLR